MDVSLRKACLYDDPLLKGQGLFVTPKGQSAECPDQGVTDRYLLLVVFDPDFAIEHLLQNRVQIFRFAWPALRIAGFTFLKRVCSGGFMNPVFAVS